MIENNSIIYLSQEDVRVIYDLVGELFKDEEPMPSFGLTKLQELDYVLESIKGGLYGKDLYPSIFIKAAVLMYLINRKHLFFNGNKRMSVACTAVFLELNGFKFTVSNTLLADKAFEIAKQSAHENLDEVKDSLSRWIEDNTASN